MKYYLGVRARSDTLDIFAYLTQETSISIADDFLADLEETLKLLCDFPQMGTRRTYKNQRLKDIRMFPVRKFKKYLIFFKRTNEGVEVVRVLHGARDLPALF